jgi:hypothetical protein
MEYLLMKQWFVRRPHGLLDLKPMIELQVKSGLAPAAIRELRERRVELAEAERSELSELDSTEEFNVEPPHRHPVLRVVRAGHPLTRLGRPAELEEIFDIANAALADELAPERAVYTNEFATIN